MELYLKVRLARSEGMSQRDLARHFNISRDSVRKMLAFSSPPGYRRTKEIKRPKLDGFSEIIDGWLEEDKKLPRKQRHTAKRIHERLKAEHEFTGGYTIIKDYVRQRERRTREMFVPPGASAGPCASRFWRSVGCDRGCRTKGPLLRPGFAAQRCLLRAGLSGGDGGGLDGRACACLCLLWRGASVGSL